MVSADGLKAQPYLRGVVALGFQHHNKVPQLHTTKPAVVDYANSCVICVFFKMAFFYFLPEAKYGCVYNPFRKTYLKLVDQCKTGNDARTYCTGIGGKLASFTTLEAYEWFRRIRSANQGVCS